MSAAAHNIELKLRARDLEDAQRRAAELATAGPDHLMQTDTYFDAPCGRLKLREVAGREPQLIAYQRPDAVLPRASAYWLLHVADAAQTCAALSAVLGRRGQVVKQRIVYWYDNVRLHFDNVHGLGQFVEFEAVLRTHEDAVRGHDQVEFLVQELALDPAEIVSQSYIDLLLLDMH